MNQSNESNQWFWIDLEYPDELEWQGFRAWLRQVREQMYICGVVHVHGVTSRSCGAWLAVECMDVQLAREKAMLMLLYAYSHWNTIQPDAPSPSGFTAQPCKPINLQTHLVQDYSNISKKPVNVHKMECYNSWMTLIYSWMNHCVCVSNMYWFMTMKSRKLSLPPAGWKASGSYFPFTSDVSRW